LDENQEEIHQYAYEGPISGAMMGLKDEFIPKENYSTFYIKSELYTDGQLVDSVEMKYDCNEIDPNQCPKSILKNKDVDKNEQWILMVVAGIVVLILFIVVIYFSARKKKEINLLIFGLIIGTSCMFFGGINRAEAKSVVWSDTWPTFRILDGYFMFAPQVSVQYNATLFNESIWTSITDGSSVAVGTKFELETLHYNTDIAWSATGGYSDTPYGYWTASAGQPVQSSQLCRDGLIFVQSYDDTQWFWSYPNLSVNPPISTITYSGTASLSCDASKTHCTINSPGTINVNIGFPETYAKWWFGARDWNGVNYDSCRLFGAFSTPTIPNQSISFNFSASSVPVNKPPSTPIISGPSTGVINTNYNFSMVSIDPEGNALRYYVFWSNDAGDAWLPSQIIPPVFPAPSGVSQSVVHQWILSGNKVLAIAACDASNCSEFAYHNIAISNSSYSCTGTIPTDATVVIGDNTNLVADTPISVVVADTISKCEYTCNSGFVKSGNTCVPITYSCTGAIPTDATLIAGDDIGLVADTPISVVTADTLAKCEYTCNAGFVKSGNVCVPCSHVSYICNSSSTGNVCDGTTNCGSTITTINRTCFDIDSCGVASAVAQALCGTSCEDEIETCTCSGVDYNWKEVAP
ncbi:MAG: hypothetical protein Athens071425_120, partial [Parcubacteria group bacterium Athens0714_25]